MARRALGLALAALLVACAEPETPRVEGGGGDGVATGGAAASPPPTLGGAVQLSAGSHCGRTERTPRATWVSSAEELSRLMARRARDRIGGAPPSLPAVDPARERVLLVEMGERPTAGYALALAEPGFEARKVGARLTLDWIEPPPGAYVAQVITSPCLVVRLPLRELGRLEVVDRRGRLRIALER